MALELIGGAVFAVLYDGVKQAMGRTETFKELLRDLKFTLECLRRQATAIQQIGQYNVELGLPNDEIEELERQMHSGTLLVGKLLNFRWWNYCCINCYTDQLVDLDRSLRRLLENLMLQEIRDVKEILDLSRKSRKELEEVKEAQLSMHKLLQQIAGVVVMEEASTSAAAGGGAIEMVPNQNEGNGGIQVASLDGGTGTALGAIFGMLLELVIEVKDKNVMFKPLLQDLKSTLESLKPFVEEMAQHNKVLYLPQEKLKRFAVKMENGVKLVCKCSKVRLWASYKKYKYTNKLLGLDRFCRIQASLLREQVARDVRETSASIRNVKEEMLVLLSNTEMVIKRMKFSTGVAQKSFDKARSSIPECYETVADDQRRKNVEFKGHIRPIAGGAPFIICYKCSYPLQIPAGFHLSRRWQKLRCGACSAVLKFSLRMKSHFVPYEVWSAKEPPTAEDDRNLASTSQQFDSQHADPETYSDDFVDKSTFTQVNTGTPSDSIQCVSETSEIWTTDLESRDESMSSPASFRGVPDRSTKKHCLVGLLETTTMESENEAFKTVDTVNLPINRADLVEGFDMEIEPR
ncbi:uncharacterized protein LOC133745300 [Rosa rugosa]|uniref:uncharacterized protein LOC133745300 n=1 Tax=Rosa rugosa TaxID=74645 RepID=UPI002B400F79|nr:uncharacterized protein LOC133745300 [Rosa rugosa]